MPLCSSHSAASIHPWKTLVLSRDESSSRVRLPLGPLLVPLSVWQARRLELFHREQEHGWPLGVWLYVGENTQGLAKYLDDLSRIEIHTEPHATEPAWTLVHRLRKDQGYHGELLVIATEKTAAFDECNWTPLSGTCYKQQAAAPY